AQLQELLPKHGGRDTQRGQRLYVTARGSGNPDALPGLPLFLGQKCSSQLLEEKRNTVPKLCGSRPSRSPGDLRLAPRNQLIAVVRQKIVHDSTPMFHDSRGNCRVNPALAKCASAGKHKRGCSATGGRALPGRVIAARP